jgi:hypothetical protein
VQRVAPRILYVGVVRAGFAATQLPVRSHRLGICAASSAVVAESRIPVDAWGHPLGQLCVEPSVAVLCFSRITRSESVVHVAHTAIIMRASSCQHCWWTNRSISTVNVELPDLQVASYLSRNSHDAPDVGVAVSNVIAVEVVRVAAGCS